MSTLLEALDHLILDARLEDVRLIAQTSCEERQKRLAAALSQLGPGHYLFGCGPYNTGLIKLGKYEISLGRHASPIEEPAESPVDYAVNDAIYLTPREVSRNHAKVRVEDDGTIRIIDEGSSTGTWVNGLVIDPGEPGMEIGSGTMIRLGSSSVNTYLCMTLGED